jgi:hypothetical protein
MSTGANFESFERELNRLVAKFERGLAEFKQPGYSESQLRTDFLDPFLAALGWDMTNRAGLIQAHREVVIEWRTDSGRADYFFRAGRKPRFVCEAKKPAEDLPPHAQQAKSYAWTIGVPLAVLTDFEELNIYIVGSEPKEDEPLAGLWRTYSFRDFIGKARELWDLLARDSVAGGVIDRTVADLPKTKLKIGKGQWVLRPDPTRNFDNAFLGFLDDQRRSLASDLLRNNEDENWEGTRLNEAVQCILDRLLFIRISEARGIDMGTKLVSLLETWQKRKPGGGALHEEPPAGWGGAGLAAPRGSLWHSVVKHIRGLDRRPPSHVPFFNGNLFKQHFSEEIVVGDDWLEAFLEKICNELASYKFGYVAVEILGTIYERFLGKVVRPHGRGAVIEEKPEVRKAGGVYYTPRYIVEYIVEQTVGKLLDEIAGGRSAGFSPLQRPQTDARQEVRGPFGDSTVKRPEGRAPSAKDFEQHTLALRFLDPACGSGSFLLRVFERVCEHWEQWLTDHPDKRKKDWCWLDAKTNTLHLTVRLKRRILRETVHGVDLDPQAVEVTQLSLYLKMLEGETTETLNREQDLFGGEEAILPPLQDNIKCGNSLIASDFLDGELLTDELVDKLKELRAFDWPVQFPAVMKSGGFDAVVGNPPYILLQDDFRDDEQLKYFRRHYRGASYKLDTYHLFIERGIKLCRPAGRLGMITPSNFLTNNRLDGLRRLILEQTQPQEIVVIDGGVFEGVSVDCAVFAFSAGQAALKAFPLTRAIAEEANFKPTGQDQVFPKRVLAEERALFTSGIINPASDLWDRLSAKFSKLGCIADVNFGKQLRDRTKFPKDVIEVSSRNAIPRTHVACVTGKDVGRYQLNWSKLACLNDTVAQSGGCWDEAKHKAKRKLLTRQIGRHPGFGFDGVGYHCLNTIFMVTLTEATEVNPSFLLGVLNSKLLRTLWVGRFYDQRQTFPKIKGTYLKELPIAVPDFSKPADKARHDKLVSLVDKMLGLMPKLRAAPLDSEKATLQNAVTATDRQIDALVYELYGLTAEEIQLVEGGQ